MALPSIIQRLYSFTGFQQSQGNATFPGTSLDTDLDQTNNTINDIVRLLKTLVRADGKLANGSITRQALAADILVGLGASRPWISTVAYAKDDTVTRGYGLYVALKNSTGVNPILDPVSWALLADLSQAVVVEPGSIGADSFAAGSVTEPKLSDGAVSTRTLGNGAVTRAKAALNLGIVPVGGELDFAGITPPSGWRFCNGEPLSRTTYAELFEALTATFPGQTTVGSAIVGGLASTFGGAGLIGARIEGPGIAPNTFAQFINDTGQLEMSQPATATATGVTLRLFPYGFDNATTFRIPDRRDRVTVGRGDMGGGSANRITALFGLSNGRSTQLGAYGGAEKITLVNANLPVNLPVGTVRVAYPAPVVSTVTYGQFTAVQSGTGALFANLWQNQAEANRSGAQPPSADFGVYTVNNGGGQAFTILPPVGVANRIIFAGV